MSAETTENRAKDDVAIVLRSHPIVHLPLTLFAILFSLPFVWLLCSSLQPREQIGASPPEWIPQRHVIEVADTKHFVTAPQTIAVDSCWLRISEGPLSGRQRLVDAIHYQDGKVRILEQQADRQLERFYQAELLQRVPAGLVEVQEWRQHKFTKTQAQRWFVEADAVSREVSPIWANYPEAIKALSSDIDDQQRPFWSLMADSRLPWHDRWDGKPITFLTYLCNTLVVAILGVIGTVLSSALAAYGLSRIPWKGRELLFAATLATMMVPFPVLMVPLYGLFRELGWIGTLLPLWVPAWFGSAFNIFLLRQFFLTIPSDLSDAARIDGCSEFGIFWRIVLPMAKPALAVVALFHFMYAWNDFLGPLLFLNDPQTFTLALGLQAYQSQSGGSEWQLLMAAAVLMVLPIIVLFFFAQKAFIQGIATTGMKG